MACDFIRPYKRSSSPPYHHLPFSPHSKRSPSRVFPRTSARRSSARPPLALPGLFVRFGSQEREALSAFSFLEDEETELVMAPPPLVPRWRRRSPRTAVRMPPCGLSDDSSDEEDTPPAFLLPGAQSSAFLCEPKYSPNRGPLRRAEGCFRYDFRSFDSSPPVIPPRTHKLNGRSCPISPYNSPPMFRLQRPLPPDPRFSTLDS